MTTTTTTTTITTSAIMSLLQPQMSFAQTYILAKAKVRSKLTREAQSPKSSLRNLVVQANMLDNIMDYINDETKRRTSEKLTSKTNTQKSSSGYLSPESSVVQFAPTPVRQVYKTSITEYEIDSDSSDDDEEDEDDNEDDYFYEDGQNDYDDLDDYEDSVVMEQDELAAIKGVYYEEDQDEEDQEDDEEDNLSETSSIYSNSSDSDLDSDSDEYYIYSDSDEIIEENNIAIEATIPRNFKSLSIVPPPSSTTSSTTSSTQSPLPSIVRSNSTPITITSLHTIDEQQEIEEEKQPELLLHENNQTID